MLHKIEQLAEISIARGCGFAGLGILTLMLGLSWDMALASEAGGILTLGACTILILKAQKAPQRPVRKTELWMMLDKGDRPQPEIAQRIIGTCLRAWYLYFALHAAGLSAALFFLSLVLQLLRA